MKMFKDKLIRAVVVGSFLFLFGSLGAHADSFMVQQDTSLLTPNVTYQFIFAVLDPTFDGASTATLSQLRFGDPQNVISTPVINLADDLVNFAYFLPVTLAENEDILSFQLDLSNNFDAADNPDQFLFQVADINGPLPTTDPSGASSLLSMNFDAGNTTYSSFDFLDANGQPIVGSGPVVTPIPEPASLLLVGVGLICLATLRLGGAHR